VILFERVDSDSIQVLISRHERMLLSNLLGQLIDVLHDEADPAARRLFPNAYPNDPEAAREFRRYTVTGLAERKISGATAMREELIDASDASADISEDDSAQGGNSGPRSAQKILLTEQQAWQWLRTLTDLRLTIADRLGIEQEDDDGRVDEAAWPLQQAYHWLGVLQESLVAAMESNSHAH
jgi:Domain of unknown function (DUF2017)